MVEVMQRAEGAVELVGLRVAAYRNLHVPGWAYSVRDVRTGRVAARVADVVLTSVALRVQPAGLARARAEGSRNVHAFAYGTIACPCQAVTLRADGRWESATYRPFEQETFTVAATGAPLRVADAVWLGGHGMAFLSAGTHPARGCDACVGDGVSAAPEAPRSVWHARVVAPELDVLVPAPR